MSLHNPTIQRSAHLELSQPSTAMTYESFKPKFPLDPFAGTNAKLTSKGSVVDSANGSEGGSGRPPWTIEFERLPTLSFLRAERRVVLVLGAPSPTLLAPLLDSPHLTSSLLIIASHRPPSLPATTQPFVRILRLRSPVSTPDGGATRLVRVLEWAERIARIWRKHGGEKVEENFEEDVDFEKGGAEKKETRRLSKSGSSLLRSSMLSTGSMVLGSSSGSPTASQSSLVDSPTASLPSLLSRRPSKIIHHERSTPVLSSSSSTKSVSAQSKSHKRTHTLPPIDPTQRPFDAVLNFAPNDASMSDKALLKHLILVTTLVRPYIVAMEESPMNHMNVGTGTTASADVRGEDAPKKGGFVRRLSMIRTSSSKSTLGMGDDGNVRSRSSSIRSSTIPSIPSSNSPPLSSSPPSSLKRISSHYRPRSQLQRHSHTLATMPTSEFSHHALSPLQAHANALATRRPGRIVHLLPMPAMSNMNGASVPSHMPLAMPPTQTGSMANGVPCTTTGTTRPQLSRSGPGSSGTAGTIASDHSGVSTPRSPGSSSSISSNYSHGNGNGRRVSLSTTSSMSSIRSLASGSGASTPNASPPHQGLSALGALSAQMQLKAQARLVRSVEAFLLSFLFAGGASGGVGGMGMGKGLGAMAASVGMTGSGVGGLGGGGTEPRPFVLPAMALGEIVDVPEDGNTADERNSPMQSHPWRIAELILAGALDMFPVDERVAKERAQARIRAMSLQNQLQETDKAGKDKPAKPEKAMSDVAQGKQKQKEALFAATYGVGVSGGYGYGFGYGCGGYGAGAFGQEGWTERRAWLVGRGDVQAKVGGKVVERRGNKERRTSVQGVQTLTGEDKALPTPPVSEVEVPTGAHGQEQSQAHVQEHAVAHAQPQTKTEVAVPRFEVTRASEEGPSERERTSFGASGLPTPPDSEEASAEEGGGDEGILMRRTGLQKRRDDVEVDAANCAHDDTSERSGSDKETKAPTSSSGVGSGSGSSSGSGSGSGASTGTSTPKQKTTPLPPLPVAVPRTPTHAPSSARPQSRGQTPMHSQSGKERESERGKESKPHKSKWKFWK